MGAAGADQPFIIISAQSAEPRRCMDIVASVMDQARAELSSRQNTLHCSAKCRSGDTWLWKLVSGRKLRYAVRRRVFTFRRGAALRLNPCLEWP